MINKKLLDILIERKVKEFVSNKLIMEANDPNWETVKRMFTKSGEYAKYLEGVEYFKFLDPNIGVVRFFADGSAFIDPTRTSTTWQLRNNELFVDNNKIEVEKVFAAKKQQRAKEKQKQQKRGTLRQVSPIDQLQTVFDWLGFIPGFGDIIDAINAIIYFARGKNFEGTLSLVAIIPGLGSPIKAALRGTADAVGGAKAVEKMLRNANAGSADELVDFYKMALDTGVLTKVQLRQLAKKGDAVATLLTRGKRWMQNNPTAASVVTLGNERALFKQIDELSAQLRRMVAGPADEAASATTKITSKTKEATSRAADWFKTTFNVGGNVVTVGALTAAKNFLRKTFGFQGSQQMKLLKDAMDVRYIKQVSNNTTLLSAMVKTSPPLNPSQLASLGLPATLYQRGSKNITRYFDRLKTTDPKKWKEVSSYLTKHTANADNLYYKKFVDNQFLKASNVFKPGAQFSAGAGDMFSRIFRFDTYRLSNPKNLDIVYNEVSDLMEKMGFDKKDDPNGVILPAIYMVFSGYLGGLKSSGTQTKTPAGTPPASGEAKPGTQGPVDTKGEIPGGSAIETTSGQIGTDFKDATGGTTDRLEKLRNIGYTDEQILDLQRELGIE